MTNSADRTWKVRDAVLQWLYRRAMDHGERHPVLTPENVTQTVNWSDEPLDYEEVGDASYWLRGEGFLEGGGTAQGLIPRPTITSAGERWVETGRSVRDFGKPPAQSPSTQITISDSQNVAIDSPGAQQSYSSVSVHVEQANRVAAELEKIAKTPGLAPETAELAVRAAAEIKEEAAKSYPNWEKVKGLYWKALAEVVVKLGDEASTDLLSLLHQGYTQLSGTG